MKWCHLGVATTMCLAFSCFVWAQEITYVSQERNVTGRNHFPPGTSEEICRVTATDFGTFDATCNGRGDLSFEIFDIASIQISSLSSTGFLYEGNSLLASSTVTVGTSRFNVVFDIDVTTNYELEADFVFSGNSCLRFTGPGIDIDTIFPFTETGTIEPGRYTFTFAEFGSSTVSFVANNTIRLTLLDEPIESSPASVDVVRGNLISGMEDDVEESDDSYFVFQPGFTLNSTEAPVWLTTNSFVTASNTADLTFALEANANTPNISQFVDAFNWNTGQFDEVSVQPVSFNNDSAIEVDLAPELYVQAGTGEVLNRVGFRQTGFTLLFPWSVSIDQFVWIVE